MKKNITTKKTVMANGKITVTVNTFLKCHNSLPVYLHLLILNNCFLFANEKVDTAR